MLKWVPIEEVGRLVIVGDYLALNVRGGHTEGDTFRDTKGELHFIVDNLSQVDVLRPHLNLIFVGAPVNVRVQFGEKLHDEGLGTFIVELIRLFVLLENILIDSRRFKGRRFPNFLIGSILVRLPVHAIDDLSAGIC